MEEREKEGQRETKRKKYKNSTSYCKIYVTTVTNINSFN